MLTPKHLAAPASPEERRLSRLYRSLGEADRHALMAFAEFLARAERPAPAPEPPPEPTHQPRPEGETVIAAIRRLSSTYSMLDRGPMLHETSALMSAHVLQGRNAAEVINALEALFERQYQDYRARALGSAPASDGPMRTQP
jgi:hypothetical protein